MAFSDKWTRAELRAVIRDEILDPSGRWWLDGEINSWISAWQDRLQEEFEPVWGSATSVGTASKISLGTDVLRLKGVYWNGKRLEPKSELEIADKLEENELPTVAYQPDASSVILWPAPTESGTATIEYSGKVSFDEDSTPMSLPAWMRYSCANYGGMRAFGRLGPNQDVNKAGKYKALWEQQKQFYKHLVTRFFPEKFLSLRPEVK